MRYGVTRCLLTVLLLLPGMFAWSVTDVVVYGQRDYPPNTYYENGKMRGIYTDILTEAFSSLKDYHITIKPTPWQRGLQLLKEGNGFALYGIYKGPDERPYVSPYSEPITADHVIVVCNKSVLDVPRSHWPEDFYHLTIGNSAGYITPGPAFFQAVKNGNINLVEAEGTQANLLNLTQKKIDCYTNDRFVIANAMSQLRNRRDEVFPNKNTSLTTALEQIQEALVIETQDVYLGYTNQHLERYPYKQDFIVKLDAQLKQMKASHRIDDIVKKYLSNNGIDHNE